MCTTRSFPLKARLAAVLLVCLTARVQAQDRKAVPIQVRPASSLDSVRQRYHATLWILRDTVGSVRGALEQLQRDPAGVSRETVVSRAMVLTDRCRVLQRLVTTNESVFDPAKAPAGARVRNSAQHLVQAMRTLRMDIDQLCIKGFALSGPGERADTLRSWAGFRSTQVERALVKYERAVSEFTAAADFKLEPAVPRR